MRPLPPSSLARPFRPAWLAPAAVLLALSGPARAQDEPSAPPVADAPAPEEPGAAITGADVLAQVDLARLEIEQLRCALDRPAHIGPPIHVRGATLRECAHHALLLQRRAARLALELRRLRSPAVQTHRARADHAQVWSYVDATLDRLADARAALGLSAPIAPLPPLREVGHDELLAALLEAERAIGALAPEPPTYGELHHTITRALGYTSSLRAAFPGRRMPTLPPFEPVSSNQTIQGALRKSLARTQDLTAASGLEPLAYLPERNSAAPSMAELCALAELIEAELAYLHARHGNQDLLPPVCDPGVRSCPNVQQRCGLLATQLLALARCLDDAPEAWLPAGSDGPVE